MPDRMQDGKMQGKIFNWNVQVVLYGAPLMGGPQVAWMLQASWGRSDKQEQEQNSRNLGPAY